MGRRDAEQGRWVGGGHQQNTNTPETTKPSHFCEGFVLYGAAPGVEYLNNCMIYMLFLFDTVIGYLIEYP